MTESPAAPPSWRLARPLLLLAYLIALLLRLGTAPQVFGGARPLLDGTDCYYHLRRAFLILSDWPHVPLRDNFLGPPDGGLVTWSAFDLALAALARLQPGPPEAALEAVGVRLPVLLGLAQVLIASTLARRLAGPRAGAIAGLLAAVLPAAVRYTLVGALDHDPAVELLTLVVLIPLAGVLGARPGRLLPAAALAAAGLAALPLTWACGEAQLGLVGLALLGAVAIGGWRSAARAGAVLAIGAVAAAAVVAPFAARSPWNGLAAGAFAGLSWLHVASLAVLAVGGAVVALAGRAALQPRERAAAGVAGGLAGLGLAVLLPWMWAPLAAGFRFVGGDDAFLASVAESRPLLRMFGPIDPRPALVRLSALPLLVPLLCARWRPRRDPALGLLAGWGGAALALALLQSRYSHAAALALAVFCGVAWERASGRWWRAAMGVALLPCLAAYVPVPGFDGLRLYGRPNDLVTTGMAEVTAYLAAAAPPPPAWTDADGEADGAVVAPWSFGNWILWRGRRPTLANPFGPYAQSAFVDGVRFWLLEEPGAVAELLLRHRVRWVAAPTNPQLPWVLAGLAGEDPRPWRRDVEGGGARFRRSMGARLASGPGLPFLREVYRTGASRGLADGSLEPLLRVYEVDAGAAAAASGRAGGGLLTGPGRAPSGP